MGQQLQEITTLTSGVANLRKLVRKKFNEEFNRLGLETEATTPYPTVLY